MRNCISKLKVFWKVDIKNLVTFSNSLNKKIHKFLKFRALFGDFYINCTIWNSLKTLFLKLSESSNIYMRRLSGGLPKDFFASKNMYIGCGWFYFNKVKTFCCCVNFQKHGHYAFDTLNLIYKPEYIDITKWFWTLWRKTVPERERG